MSSSPGRPRKYRTRAWLIGAATVCAVVLVVTAVATRGFGLVNSSDRPSNERAAQDRCESDVVSQLASPSTAKLSNVQTASADLEPDSKDLFSLLDAPLKGVDHSRITVLNVAGVVDAPDARGGTMHDPFNCRAYFIDGHLAHTLVLFDHGH